MSFTPNKSGKGRGSAASGSGASSSKANYLSGVSFWLMMLILVLLFFASGVYVGSLFLAEADVLASKDGSSMIGLPGTKNIISTLNREAHLLLRREEIKSPSDIKDVTTKLIEKQLSDPGPLLNLRQEESRAPPAAVVVSPEVPSDKSFVLHKQSFVVNDACFISAPNNLDSDTILIAGWVYLDESETKDTDMRTIYSNKYPGCESSTRQYGISLYINGWQSKDHKLYLEYGGMSSGCNKVISDDFQFSLGKWYHVASFISSNTVLLFVDGQVVATARVADPHVVQTTNSLSFGQYAPDSPYTLFGNLEQFVILRGMKDDSVTSVTSYVQAIKNNDFKSFSSMIYAHYPFDYKKGEKVAHDIVNNRHANYLCGSGTDGVKIRLVDGVNDRPVTDEMKAESDRLGHERKEKIKEGMKFVWEGYKNHAWGRDELKPIAKHGQDNWGGIGMTILDSLDTLWLMGMKDEFNEAKKWVENSLQFDHAGTVSVFEITIRALGGLLAAYDLSQEEVFLTKAKDLGDRLIRAFQTRSGIPTAMVNLRTGSPSSGWSGNSAILSELGTLQVEFRYLAHHTHNPSYESTSMKPLKIMQSKNAPNGLYPIKIRMDDGGFADSMITFGALGDSFYEYLLKIWIQGGKKETWLREMYDRAMDGAIDKLLMASSPSGLAFFSDWNGHSNFRKMDHLVCFVPGILALGAYTDPNGLESERAQRHLKVAKALMYTCREMYHRTQTKIAPEYVEFPQGRDMITAPNAPFYILRPETAESLFVLNQLTGDPIYRDWAWEIYEAINKECRVGSGFGSLRNVDNRAAGVDDRMESFFLAETMKYLYLAQDPDKPVDLMKKVFNTEAHPLSILDDSHKPIL